MRLSAFQFELQVEAEAHGDYLDVRLLLPDPLGALRLARAHFNTPSHFPCLVRRWKSAPSEVGVHTGQRALCFWRFVKVPK
jgi:hypothetical protein